jgi:hypothetical protein
MQSARLFVLPLTAVIVAGAAVALLANAVDASGGLVAIGVIGVGVLAGMLGARVAERLPSSHS